jgi:uncharacterized membrane protein
MVDQGPAIKKGRRWRWILGVSLALNFVFIGLFAGAALRHAGDEPRSDRSRVSVQGYAAPYVRALPPEARRALGQKLRRGDIGERSNRAARRMAYEQMTEAMRAAPFDIARVQAILERQSQSAAGIMLSAQALWLEQIAGMSDVERAAYADRLEEVLAKRGSHKSKRPRD